MTKLSTKEESAPCTATTCTAFKKMHVDIEVCGYRLCVTDLCECSLHFYFKGQNASKSRQTPARKHYWNPFSRDSLHSQGQGNLISSSKYFPIGCKFFWFLYLNVIGSDYLNLKLWKSISPGRSVPLSKFTVQQNLKNRPGALIGQENEQGYVIHYALLVLFFFFSKAESTTLILISSADLLWIIRTSNPHFRNYQAQIPNGMGVLILKEGKSHWSLAASDAEMLKRCQLRHQEEVVVLQMEKIFGQGWIGFSKMKLRSEARILLELNGNCRLSLSGSFSYWRISH